MKNVTTLRNLRFFQLTHEIKEKSDFSIRIPIKGKKKLREKERLNYINNANVYMSQCLYPTFFINIEIPNVLMCEPSILNFFRVKKVLLDRKYLKYPCSFFFPLLAPSNHRSVTFPSHAHHHCHHIHAPLLHHPLPSTPQVLTTPLLVHCLPFPPPCCVIATQNSSNKQYFLEEACVVAAPRAHGTVVVGMTAQVVTVAGVRWQWLVQRHRWADLGSKNKGKKKKKKKMVFLTFHNLEKRSALKSFRIHDSRIHILGFFC